MAKLRLALLTVLPLVCASAAVAQPAPSDQGAPPAMSEHHHMDRTAFHKEMCSDMYAHRAGQLAYVQAKLNLTEQQQATFAKWRQAVLDEAAKGRTACLEAAPKSDTPPTILEREAHAEKMLSLKLQGLQATRPALEALYASLSPDQKTILDRSFEHPHGFHGRHGHGGHHEMMMHQPD